jgi:SAM-dependent methyltransferase
MSVEPDHPELTARTQAIWERNARWWDERVGEGDDFHRRLVRPATERLLEARPGQYVLDLACGNGGFARRLAELGCRVLACDFSPTFLERARSARRPLPSTGRAFRRFRRCWWRGWSRPGRPALQPTQGGPRLPGEPRPRHPRRQRPQLAPGLRRA